MTTIEDRINDLLRALETETKRVNDLVAWMRANATKIEQIGLTPVPYGGGIDFDNADRQQVLEIIKAFPGTWDKSVNGNTSMNYVRRPVEGEPLIRIWAGELPPSCKVVEEEIEVPAHREKRQKIVCNGATETEAKETEAA